VEILFYRFSNNILLGSGRGVTVVLASSHHVQLSKATENSLATTRPSMYTAHFNKSKNLSIKMKSRETQDTKNEYPEK